MYGVVPVLAPGVCSITHSVLVVSPPIELTFSSNGSCRVCKHE